ncbi:MAG: hypothetical protein MK135_16660, partial [Polyangiaceae bacterium]|nr:hypothetical protein [Polyangiaceae bacterium]
PAHLEALTERIEIFGVLELPQGLVESLEARAKAATDQEVIQGDLIRAAKIYSDRLANIERAIELWQELEQRFGRTHETVVSLVQLCERAERFSEVAALLEESIASDSDEARQVEKLGHLGDVQRQRLDQAAAAVATYRRALQIRPAHSPSRAGLRALMDHDSLAHEVVETLAKAHGATDEKEAVIELLDVRVERASDPQAAGEVLASTASLQRELGRKKEAFESLARSFALSTSEEVESRLHTWAQEVGAHQRLAQAYGEAADAVSANERKFQLFVSKGRVEADILEAYAEAADSYRSALSVGDLDEIVLARLIEAAVRGADFALIAEVLIQASERSGYLIRSSFEALESALNEVDQWAPFLSAFESKLLAVDDLPPQLLHDLWRQLGLQIRDRLSHTPRAEAALLQAVDAFPQTESLQLLADLQRSSPSRSLVQTLLRLSDLLGEDLLLLQEAGTVALGLEPQAESTREILYRLFDASISCMKEKPEAKNQALWSSAELVKIFREVSDEEAALSQLEKAAEAEFSPEERAALLFEAATIAESQQQVDRGIHLAERVLVFASGHRDAIALLSKLFESKQDWAKLVALRERELEIFSEPPRCNEIRLDWARILELMGAPSAEREALLRANLAISPGDEDTIAVLESLLVENKEFEKLCSLFEEQAQATRDDKSMSARLYLKAGELAEVELDDRERLRLDYRASAEAEPSVRCVERLADLARESERWSDLARWLKLRLGLEFPDESSETGKRVAVVHELAGSLLRSDDENAALNVLEAEIAQEPHATE